MIFSLEVPDNQKDRAIEALSGGTNKATDAKKKLIEMVENYVSMYEENKVAQEASEKIEKITIT